MADRKFLDWPFFEPRHKALALDLDAWAAANLVYVDHTDTDAACRALVAMLGRAGWLTHSAVDPARPAPLDVRSLCVIRETLARHDGLADFAFAMQGLGTGAISLFGTAEQQARWLPETRSGRALSAFALTEPQSGSDVAGTACTAARDGEGYVLNGEKTWISNGGIADFYTVFARTGEAPGARGLSAFLLPADTPGLSIAERLETIAPHPLARLRLDDLRLPASALIGKPGDGFRIAMSVLDVFRSTVAAAALGFARRALDETLARTTQRQLFTSASASATSPIVSVGPGGSGLLSGGGGCVARPVVVRAGVAVVGFAGWIAGAEGGLGLAGVQVVCRSWWQRSNASTS